MDTCPKSHERFVDFDKCISIIEELHAKLDSQNEDECKNKAEKLVESFRKVIDSYQEQPELLDPYLSELIQRLTENLDDFNISRTRFHTVFKFLYQLIKVAGFKSIGKKFPHETDKLPLLVELLSKEDLQDKINWQTRFVLTVWLSIVILTPFDLAKFDLSPAKQRVPDRIYSTLMRSLELYDSCQHVTAYCLAKFFSRPDVLKSDQFISKFMSLALEELANVKTGSANSMDDIKLIGYLRTLCYMSKFLPRDEMKLRCQTILNVVVKLDVDKINRELVNHLIIKLIQRAGLALLPRGTTTWRYQRGSRILGQLSASAQQQQEHKETNIEEEASQSQRQHQLAQQQEVSISNDEESDSAEQLESILSVLFVAAQNGQTRIRWSAAKGIARLASRLSRERASEVIDMVIMNFFDAATSSEFAWHGGSLTLAEMSRQGLILEEKLDDVTRIVGQAIIYDKIKGSFAVGAHVREAACYVCWAMARAYEDHLLKPYVSSISVSLLCTMLFDRELQCRRAASAAFQELVGRQGTFNEEGINILTNVDYLNVGQRQFSYIHLASQVAAYGEKYSKPFVEHLLSKKIGHWDLQIRRLASDSLSALMLHFDNDHDFIRSFVIPKLIESIDQDSDNNAKHGGILGLAKIICGLAPLQFEFGQKLVDYVGGIVEKCAKQLKSKQQAPNFIEAIGYVISSAEKASFNYKQVDSSSSPSSSSDTTLKQWESISLSALDNDNPALRDIGSDALLTLYRTYYKFNKTDQDRILTILNKSLSSLNESSRCGALRALSKLGKNLQIGGSIELEKGSGIRVDAETPDIILISLTSYIAKETYEKANEIVFAQAKAEACDAFVNFIRDSLDKSSIIVSSNLIQAGYDALLEKTEDYTFDKRGDIGVVVRRSAIKALEELTLHLISIGLTSLLFVGEDGGQRRVRKIIAKTLQQAVSYNNSAREIAALAFYRLIRAGSGGEEEESGIGTGAAGCVLPANSIPHEEYILSLFDKFGVSKEGELFNWRDDSTPIFVSLLGKPEYSRDLWIGLIQSVGQVSDMCAKQFRDALTDYILTLADSPRERELVFQNFLELLEEASGGSGKQQMQKQNEDKNKAASRLLTSGLVVADYLLTQGLMNELSLEFQKRLAQFCFSQSRESSNDPKRLNSVARVLSSMLQFGGQIQRDCLESCLNLLVNGYARVRTYTAEQLYLSIMTYQEDLEANLSQFRTGNGGRDEGGCKMEAEDAASNGIDLDSAMELLSQTNWREPLERVKPVRDQISSCLTFNKK